MNDPPQRRRTVVAATRRPVLRLVRVIVEADPEPDVSYLEQEDFEDRSLAYKKGDFSFVGVRAEAEVVIEDVLQTLTSGGLYGVESDSEDEYIDEIAAREWEALRGVLKAVGVPTEQLPLDVQREWIEWRT
jgi:hypothetical protein